MPISKKKIKERKVSGKSGDRPPSWPLPPSSVFRCRPARPFLNPELFYPNDFKYDYAYSSISSNSSRGIIMMGDFSSSISDNEYEAEDLYLEYDEAYAVEGKEPIYADPVELNGRERIIEYSPNPEKGIDVGNLELEIYAKTKEHPLLGKDNEREWDLPREEELNRDVLIKLREEVGFGELGKIYRSSSTKQSANSRKKTEMVTFSKGSETKFKAILLEYKNKVQ